MAHTKKSLLKHHMIFTAIYTLVLVKKHQWWRQAAMKLFMLGLVIKS